MKIVTYEHHGTEVKVREDLKGRHREFCLCFAPCAKLKIGKPDNCPRAQRLYKYDVEFGMTTPVWECPEFEEGGQVVNEEVEGGAMNEPERRAGELEPGVDGGLSIIEEGKLKPRIEGDQLWLAVRSDSIEQLASPDAKKLAFEARHQHGFANAGIEKYSGPSPVNSSGAVDVSPRKEGEDYAGYAVLFKLTLPAV